MIVFLNDKNLKEAIRILDSVTEIYNAPDYFLLKAEPALLFQAAEVYKANGQLEKAYELKEELIGAVYKLGPNIEKQVHDL